MRISDWSSDLCSSDLCADKTLQMAAMSKGGLFLALVLMLAACAPHQSRVPRGAEDWPVNKRVQRLPPAQPLPPPKPQWVAREVTPDAVEVPAQPSVVRPGDPLRPRPSLPGAPSETSQ